MLDSDPPAWPEIFSGGERVEQQELRPPFDTIIVFGQGPVKPVLLPEELTPQQQEEWKEFKKNPLHNKEPDFRVIEGEAYRSQLENIDSRTDLTDKEKQELKENIRQKWQRLGRFALNRWGRQNALAAGVALVLGITPEIILSGGRTMPDWAKKTLPEERQKNWPSEAELMRDLIVRRFGGLYFKKFGRPIETAIKIENQSTNTLENFAYAINNNSDLLLPEKNIGLLGADFHVRRIVLLAKLFSVSEAPEGSISAQQVLRKRAQKRQKKVYQDIIRYMTDFLENPDLQERVRGEECWLIGLIKPEYLSYWLGYIGLIESPAVIQRVVRCLSNDLWIKAVRKAFEEVGLDFDSVAVTDLIKLERTEPNKYNELRNTIANLTSSEHRVIPPKI